MSYYTICLLLVISVFGSGQLHAVSYNDPLAINILYLHQILETEPVLSNILPPPKDQGIQGAILAIDDSNTTGKFLNQRYKLHHYTDKDPDNLFDKANQWVADGNSFIISQLPKQTLLELHQTAEITKQALIFNVSAKDNSLREQQCTTGLLHIAPSRAMLTDALVQLLISKRWNTWMILQGQHPNDQLFIESLFRSAKRFGGKVIDLKKWTFDTDLRRTAQQELPAFTRVADYHVTLIADEVGDFGEYVLYNTWLPRPVAGTQGLTAIAWHRVVEQWGAAQLQNRFTYHAQRAMNDVDYNAWVAVRSIAEAVTRLNTTDMKQVYNYLLGDRFGLAAFKGRKLSFRNWNGQLRQPIPLVHSRSLVSQSPQSGYIHPTTELDTLGYDQPEVSCDFSSTMQ